MVKQCTTTTVKVDVKLTGLAMIGAMPAVAVRHERRKQEKRTKRPSQLILQSPMSHASSSPSPVQSPPLTRSSGAGADAPDELYIFGKVSVLHVVVVSLLLGAILVIVGLVQLTPGADASQHRYLLLSCGGTLLLTGMVLAALRCCVLPWYVRRRRAHHRGAHSPLGAATAAATTVAAAPANSTPKTRSRANSTVIASNGKPRGSVCSPMTDKHPKSQATSHHNRRRSVAEVSMELRREREEVHPQPHPSESTEKIPLRSKEEDTSQLPVES